MAYTDRIAVTGDPVPLEFIKLIDLPTLPGAQYGVDTPHFFAGWTLEGSPNRGPDFQFSNTPGLWATSYDSSTPEFTGLLTMGVAHADYSIREAGTGASDDNSNYFEAAGTIDGMFVGINYTLTPAGFGYYSADVALEFQRQVLGDFTGGTASVVSAAAAEAQTITFEDYLNTAGISYVGAALASTTLAPSALFVMHPNYADGPDGPTTEAVDIVGAYKMDAVGAVTRVGLFKGDVGANPTQGAIYNIFAQCRDVTHHYFIRAGNESSTSFTSCLETAWGTYTYNNYTPKFTDPDLPVLLGTLIAGNSTYQLLAIYGTDVGFLISYLKYDGSMWNPLFVLVDKEWTTVRHITATAGDATATTILAQGVRDPLAPPDEGADFGGNAISMMMEGGYAWLIGGTPAVPLIVESTVPAIDTGDESGDTTIRCWAFSLDDHDFYVLRLGSSETLVYDLKTEQWSSWESPDRTNWRLHVGQNWVGFTDIDDNNTDVIAGDDVLGVLWVLSADRGLDDRPDNSGFNDPFIRVVTGGIQVFGRNTIPCGAVTLDVALGAPVDVSTSILLEISDDFGHTWSDCGTVTVTAADYGKVIEWRTLGLIKAPGRMFRFTDTGATVRLSGANMR